MDSNSSSWRTGIIAGRLRGSFRFSIEPVVPYINSSSDDIVYYDMSFPIAKQVGGSLKTLVGASFWLECNAGGIPKPQVTWKKDNLPIHANKRIKVSDKKVEVLGTMMSDTGWYSCTVANGAGTVTKSTFVRLLGKNCKTSFVARVW